MSDSPLVIVSGPPAVGKTSVRRHLRVLLRQRFSLTGDIGIDDILRDLYRQGRLDGLATLGDDGALILGRWPEAVEMALARLTEQLSAPDRPVLVELPIFPDWLAGFLRDQELAGSTLFIYLHAPLDVRVRRNRERRAARVSEANLRQMTNQIPHPLLRELTSTLPAFFALDTTHDLDTVLSRSAEATRTFLEQWYA